MLVKSYYSPNNAAAAANTPLFYAMPGSAAAAAAAAAAPTPGATTLQQQAPGLPNPQQAAAAAAAYLPAAAALQLPHPAAAAAFSQQLQQAAAQVQVQLSAQQQLHHQQHPQQNQAVTSVSPAVSQQTHGLSSHHHQHAHPYHKSSTTSSSTIASSVVTSLVSSHGPFTSSTTSGSSLCSTSPSQASTSSPAPSPKKFRPGYTRPSSKSQRYIPKPLPQELGNLKLYSSPDILICGNCREMFSDLVDMLDHKKHYCKLRFTCKCDSANNSTGSCGEACINGKDEDTKDAGSSTPPSLNNNVHGDSKKPSSKWLHCVTCKAPFSNAWDLMVHVQTAHMLNIYLLADSAKLAEQQALRDQLEREEKERAQQEGASGVTDGASNSTASSDVSGEAKMIGESGSKGLLVGTSMEAFGSNHQ